MASAAVVAIAIAAVAIGVTPKDAQQGKPRADAPSTEETLKAIVLVVPDGTLDKSPGWFEWRALPGATAYELRLYADDATIIWTSRQAPATVVNRPPSLKLPSGHQYHWQVRAFADGKAIGESRLATFEII